MRIEKSSKLHKVCYDIRGPVLEQALRLEEEGFRILKLNIGNPAPFDFPAPDEIIHDVISNLPTADGYCDARGLFAARKAVMQECQLQQIPGVELSDIYMGNGVSELIVMAMQALLNDDEEVLIPAPDYPLWTAAVTLAGGAPRHYPCEEGRGWQPDLAHLESLVGPRTRGLVVINPNNPTGAVYQRETLEGLVDIARRHGLIIFADEIYSKIIYDDAEFIPLASLATDVPCVTFNGLSKAYRMAGFRSGWLVISGDKDAISDYAEGIYMLASMRLCANVPAQLGVQTALGGYQSIDDLVKPQGRLHRQRQSTWAALSALPGVSCHKPQGALYLFIRLDPQLYPIHDDEHFVLDLLNHEKMLLVQGSAFNLKSTQHFRWVFLPREDDMRDAVERFGRFLAHYRHDHGTEHLVKE